MVRVRKVRVRKVRVREVSGDRVLFLKATFCKTNRYVIVQLESSSPDWNLEFGIDRK